MSNLQKDLGALGPLAQSLLNGSFAKSENLGKLPQVAASPEDRYRAERARFERLQADYELGQVIDRLSQTPDGQMLFDYLRRATVVQHHYDPTRHDDGVNTIVEGIKRDGMAGVYWNLLGLIKYGRGDAPRPPENPAAQEEN